MPAIASDLATLLHQAGFVYLNGDIVDDRGRLIMTAASLELFLQLDPTPQIILGKLARRLRMMDGSYDDPSNEVPPAQNDFE